MEQLNEDIRFLLHDQLALIENIEHYLEPVRDVLSLGEEFQSEVDGKYLYLRLKNKIKETIKLNINFIKFVQDRNLNNDNLQSIVVFNESMDEYLGSNVELNPIFTYDKLIRLEKSLRMFKKEPIPNERFKVILKEIQDIKRVLAIYFLFNARIITNHIKTKSEDFLELIRKQGNDEDFLPFEIVALIEQVLRNFQLNSDLKRLKIERHFENAKYFVIGSRPNLLRSFENLINNAIKYNRTLKNSEVWIKIKVAENEDFIVIEIENWGVGILQYEIEEELIFKTGYKGVYSKMNKIEGSGIGLSYAKREIEKSGGLITIESIPVKKHLEVTESSNFLTTVTVKLKKAIISAHNNV